MVKVPTSVQAVLPTGTGTGKIIMAGLPGFEIARDGSGYMDPESCSLTFDALKNHSTTTVFIFVEELEFPEFALSILKQASHDIGANLVWIPVPDYGIPDDKARETWVEGRAGRVREIRDGHSICLVCLYGAGRSGMMAAATFTELGQTGDQAINHVRSYFSEAIGNMRQAQWVKAYADRLAVSGTG